MIEKTSCHDCEAPGWLAADWTDLPEDVGLRDDRVPLRRADYPLPGPAGSALPAWVCQECDAERHDAWLASWSAE